MKVKRYIYFLISLLIYFNGHSQNEYAKLIGESDGISVKLMWVLNKWPSGLEGFNVKRRSTDGNKKGKWDELNSSMIFPEISANKSYTNAIKNFDENQRLFNKVQKLMLSNKLKEVKKNDFIKRVSSDPNAVKGVSFANALDYDIALISGFAFVDLNVPAGNVYEYGLFPVINGKVSTDPVSLFEWKYGNKPDLSITGGSLKTAITSVKNKIQLKIIFNGNDIRNKHAAGFNIYKSEDGKFFSKMNISPVSSSSSADASVVSYFDNDAKEKGTTVYSVALVSIFGNEGPRIKTIYDPEKFPKNLTSPVVSKVGFISQNYHDGLKVEWTFDKLNEPFIRSFLLEKAVLPNKFKVVAILSNVSARSYTDKEIMPLSSYIQYRITAITEDELKFRSNEFMIYYLPEIKPQKPTGLAGKLINEKGKTFVELSWNSRPESDTLTSGYKLFASQAGNRKLFLEGSLPLIKGYTFRYEVFNVLAAKYHFSITSVSKLNAMSELSDTLEITVPSRTLPLPNISVYTLDSNRVTLNWDYPAIDDLKGFRIFQDGNLVANEFQLGKTAKKFSTPSLAFSRTYKFELMAVSESGVISEKSIMREVYILKK